MRLQYWVYKLWLKGLMVFFIYFFYVYVDGGDGCIEREVIV